METLYKKIWRFIKMVLNFGGTGSGLFPQSRAAGDGFRADILESRRNENIQYWSNSGSDWIPFTTVATTFGWTVSLGVFKSLQAGLTCGCSVSLPQGAKVTKVTIYGNAGAGGTAWILARVNHARANQTLASGTVNSADTTIDFEVIDNENYFYNISCAALANNDEIYGAVIEYTFEDGI